MNSRKHQMFLTRSILRELKIILNHQKRLIQRNQLRCQKHQITLKNEKNKRDKNLEDFENQTNFLRQIHIKNYKIRQILKKCKKLKTFKKFKRFKVFKRFKTFKKCEFEKSFIQFAFFNDELFF